MAERVELKADVPIELAGKRLDQVAAQLFSGHSRARLQSWIKSGELLVDGQTRRPRDAVQGGEELAVSASVADSEQWTPEALDLDIIYEDSELLVVNKPAGLVVHPAAGNPAGTLLNALLAHNSGQAALPRGGIVHRLDKDTTGLMVVAKTLTAHTDLVSQLQAREVHRQYLAVVHGWVTSGGQIDAAIGRHPVNRKKMAVVKHGGKPAVTHYRIDQCFAHHTLLRIDLETGRTHQIRVHMSHRGHPLIGDPVYGGRPRVPAGADDELIATLRGFSRQALHARALELSHPSSGELISWEVEPPADFSELLAVLAQYDSTQ